MSDYGQYLKQNSDAITAIAPTIWHLAQDGVSLTADDAIMAAAAKLKKQSGVRVIPTVFDNESYNQGTLKPRLLKLFASPHKFIASIVNASLVRSKQHHRQQTIMRPASCWPAYCHSTHACRPCATGNALCLRVQVYGFDGVNLDFEPRWKASPADAAGLLKFVRLARHAHAPHGAFMDCYGHKFAARC